MDAEDKRKRRELIERRGLEQAAAQEQRYAAHGDAGEPDMRELLEIVEDLAKLTGLGDHEPRDPDIHPPPAEPGVRTMYADLAVGALPARDYSIKPRGTWVYSLDRTKYATPEEAHARFEQVRAANGWRVYGGAFWTRSRWCWTVY